MPSLITFHSSLRSSQSWSFMNPTYETEAWYPSSPKDTTYVDTSASCSAPNGYGAEFYNISFCDSSNCELHSQCGPSSFCCLSSHHPGCSSHWDLPGTSASSPWRSMLFQDLEEDCYFQESSGNSYIAKSKYDDSDAAKSCYSYLDEFESMRQTSNGMFHMKVRLNDERRLERRLEQCDSSVPPITVSN